MAVTLNANTSTGFIATSDTSGVLQLQTAGTTAVTVDASQNVTISTGNVVIGTAGKGIDFSITTGTGTSELFADYEEGTWTPTITPLSGSLTSYTSSGRYTKIGRVVNLDFLVSIITVGTASSVMVVTNLPFNTAGLNQAAGVMRENAVVGMNGALVSINGTTLYGAQYNGGSPFVVNYTWVCQMTYQV